MKSDLCPRRFSPRHSYRPNWYCSISLSNSRMNSMNIHEEQLTKIVMIDCEHCSSKICVLISIFSSSITRRSFLNQSNCSTTGIEQTWHLIKTVSWREFRSRSFNINTRGESKQNYITEGEEEKKKLVRKDYHNWMVKFFFSCSFSL